MVVLALVYIIAWGPVYEWAPTDGSETLQKAPECAKLFLRGHVWCFLRVADWWARNSSGRDTWDPHRIEGHRSGSEIWTLPAPTMWSKEPERRRERDAASETPRAASNVGVGTPGIVCVTFVLEEVCTPC